MPVYLIGEEGPSKGLVFHLEEKDWTLGRDPEEADLVLDDETVSRKHARLIHTPEGFVLQNLSQMNPTLVNGEEIEEEIHLKEQDRIQIGDSVFLFSEKLPTPEERPAEEEKEEEKREQPEPQPRTPKTPGGENNDTIFEDTESEAELPFNLLAETPFLLKVISGPNAGAEIGIEKGKTFTIGKDPNTCEIAFQDLSVSRSHARLLVSPEGVIEIEDLSSKNGTVVNGRPITEKTTITPQDMIALGTTVFLILDREAPQETIYSPPPAAPAAEEKKEAAEEAKRAARDWKKIPLPPKHLFYIGAGVLSFFILFMSFFSLFKSKDAKEHEEARASTCRIKEALAKFPTVQFSFNPLNGHLFLAGHIVSPVDYQEMRYLLAQIPCILETEDTVVIDEGVAKAMNEVLASNEGWHSINVRAAAPGKFIASGSLQNPEEMASLSDYFTTNFPYLDRLENQVVVVTILDASLQNLLISRGLGAVTVQFANGEVLLGGVYDRRKEKELASLIEEIGKINGVARVKNLAIPTHPDAAAIDLSNNFQVGGTVDYKDKGYNVVLNGKIYGLGDLIDGLQITSIRSRQILLEKDGIKYKIDYEPVRK